MSHESNKSRAAHAAVLLRHLSPSCAQSDALHLASVLRAKQASVVEIVFVASDKELVKAAEAAGLAVLDPESKDAVRSFRRRRLREPIVEDQ